MRMLLSASTDIRFGEDGGYQTIGEVFREGGQTFILGMLTVFLSLSLLWGILELFHLLCFTLPQKRKAAKVPEAPLPTETATVEQPTDDTELVAVIAAAIAAAQADNPSGEFRVVSFRRK